MSADNWTKCPKCAHDRVEKTRLFREQVDKAYGKVSAREYDQLIQELRQMEFVSVTVATLREDYEFYGIEDGVLHVEYSAYCTKCEWTFNHESTHDAPLD